MNALLTAEMAVWVPEDAPGLAMPSPQQPERALAALDRQGLRLSGTVLAIALLSALAAGVVSLFGTI
jgi:hypothetical protein